MARSTRVILYTLCIKGPASGLFPLYHQSSLTFRLPACQETLPLKHTVFHILPLPGFGSKRPKVLPLNGMVEKEVIDESYAHCFLCLEIPCDVGPSTSLLLQVSLSICPFLFWIQLVCFLNDTGALSARPWQQFRTLYITLSLRILPCLPKEG